MLNTSQAVSGARNRPMSFCAYEKERLIKIWRFLSGRKGKDEPEIGIFALCWKIYKEMPKSVKKIYHRSLLLEFVASFCEGNKPVIDMLVYGALPALLLGSEKAVVAFCLFFGLRILCWFLASFFGRLGSLFSQKYERIYSDIRDAERYAEIVSKPRAFFIVNVPETVSGLVNTITSKEIQLIRQFGYAFSGVTTAATMAIGLFVVSPCLTIIIALLSLVEMEYLSHLNYYFRGIENKNRLFLTRVYQTNRDVMRNSPLVQDACSFPREYERMRKRLARATGNNLKIVFARNQRNYAVFYVCRVLTMILSGVIAVNDVIESGDIGRFALITSASFGLLNRLGSCIRYFNDDLIAVRNSIVDTEKQLFTPKALERLCGTKKLSAGENSVVFKEVSFAYPKIKDVTRLEMAEEKKTYNETVLRDVNVEIKQGGITVIAGVSGQGKSTLISLIRHDYDVKNGKVLLGGVDVQELSDETINEQIAFVDQNVHFFDNTLLYNLKYFNPDADDEEVARVLEAVGLADDVKQFDDGLNYRIGQDGRALSGGQRQRLALARIFLANRPIIIMDEPTIGLDPKLSFKIMKILKELAKTKMVILVTHNPTEIALADRVLIIQNGKIVADGEPLELVETSDFLKSCLTKQDILSKRGLFDINFGKLTA